MKTKSLTFKLAIVSSILVSIGFIILLALSVTTIDRQVTKAMVEQLTEENRQLAKQAQILLESGAPVSRLQQFVDDTVSSSSRIAYAIVIDNTVTAIAHSDSEKIGKNYSDDTGYTVPAATKGEVMTSQFWADVQKAWTYDIMCPITVNGELYGSMDVGIYNSAVDETVAAVRNTLIVAIIILLVIIVVVFDLYLRIEFKDFDDLTKACNAIGEGDFTFEINEKVVNRSDELGIVGKAVLNLKKNLGGLIMVTSENAERLSQLEGILTAKIEETREKSKEIVYIIEQAVEGTNRQKDISGENALLTSEMTDGINQVSSNIANISNAANETANAAEDGSDKLNHVVMQMQKIGGNVTQIREQIHELESMSGKIEHIVEMIADIASQTNLLSLNASIEAARAGEQGKGFAVVASEVGSLAVQSSKSASDIADMIKQIQESIRTSVLLMEEGYESAQGGIELAENTKVSFAGITEKIAMISDEMNNVTQVMKSNEQGAMKLQNAMNEIEVISEEVSQSTDNASRQVGEQDSQMHDVKGDVKELAKLSRELIESLSVFKI